MAAASQSELPGTAFSREEIFENLAPTLIHRGRSFTQPDIFTFNKDGQACLVKDYARRPWLIRWLLTRRWLRKEYEVLDTLRQIPGIPLVLGFVDRDAFVMEQIIGSGPMPASREITPEQYPPREFFVDMARLIGQVHAAGIGHGDIRRTNILVAANGRPFLIDFATARHLHDKFWPPWTRALSRIIVMSDNYSSASIRDSFYPELLTETERELLDQPPLHMLFGRFLRKKIYRRFLKPKRWRERVARWRNK